MTIQHQRYLSSHLTLTIVPAPVGWEVWRSVPDDNDHGSPFFLSYAHGGEGSTSAGDPDRHVEKFFHNLAYNVGQLTNLPAGVPAGFMDRELRGGMWWTPELMRAAGTCQVLIALLSARYLSSKWCRIEWHAFSQRTVRERQGGNAFANQSCIIPVLWAPLPRPEVAMLPAHIRDRQIFTPGSEPSPRVPGHYRENGVFGMMQMGRPRNSYQIVSWQLAKLIASIYHSQWTEHRFFELPELCRGIRGDELGC